MTDEIELRSGPYDAVVRRTGACLHRLRHRGRDLLLPGPGDATPDFAGMLLAPWPNRVIDARYTFAGEEHVLEANEPDRGHALHGLVWSVPAEVRDHGEGHVVLVHRMRNRPGYPFEVDVITSYTLDEGGLTCAVEAWNVGGREAPYGCGSHPYFRAATGRSDDCVLAVPASERMEVSPERLVPEGLTPVDGTPYDFREPRRIGDLQVDNAFSGLARGPDGRARARLTDPDGNELELWADEEFGWLHVYTCDRPDTDWDRRGVAIEPTTCPPGAFGSGDDLVVLAPGHRHRATWGVAVPGGTG